MNIRMVLVRIERQQRTGLLRARVVQEAADGLVFGRNLCSGHQFSSVASARRQVRHILVHVDEITFEGEGGYAKYAAEDEARRHAEDSCYYRD